VVLDTVKDVVIGDIGDEIMNTSGVAVRPFWWSKECLQVLGLATGDSGSDTTAAGDTSGSTSSTAAGGSGGTSTGGSADGTGGGEGTNEKGASGEGGEGGLSGGWIALIAVLAAIAVAAVAGFAFLIGRGSSGRTSTLTGVATTAAQGDATAPPFCSECGGALNPEAKFCAGCGKPV
jgi:hypothetical protein